MINVKRFCKDDISKIENYDAAIADTTQTWHCHHKDEVKILPSGIKVIRTREELKENNRYYNCPANELIFLTQADHKKLHNMNMSEESRNKMSKSLKGKTLSDEHKKKIAETLKNKTKSEDTKRKMSEAKKAYWARRSNGV